MYPRVLSLVGNKLARLLGSMFEAELEARAKRLAKKRASLVPVRTNSDNNDDDDDDNYDGGNGSHDGKMNRGKDVEDDDEMMYLRPRPYGRK